MAKKSQKAKATKKGVVKKAAPKKAVAKSSSKTIASKSSKKTVAKKAPLKKAKPVAKIVKKPVAKSQPIAKQLNAKKAVVKTVIKAKPPVKAVVKEKPKTKVVEPKTTAKPNVKQEAKAPVIPAKIVEKVNPVMEKKSALSKKKVESTRDLDDDASDNRSSRMKNELDESMYKPKPKKFDVNQPKPHIATDNRTRYSDKELEEFRELIKKKLEEAQKDYELLKSTLSHKDDHGTDDTSPTFKLLEDGSDVLSKEETAHLASRQEKFIQNLKNALIRIENKTYGICRATGRLISKERLRSVPHATLDIDAKLEQQF